MAKYLVSFIVEDLPTVPEQAKEVILDFIHEGMIGISKEDVNMELLSIEDFEKE